MSHLSSAVPFVVIGVAMIAVGEPMRRRRVGPNRVYGLRTRATLADESVWYDGNQYAGRLLVVAGTVVCVAGLSVPWLTSGRWVTEVLAGLSMICTVTSSVMSIRYANTLLAARSSVVAAVATTGACRDGDTPPGDDLLDIRYQRKP